jgi:DNA replication and repair protein RecF
VRGALESALARQRRHDIRRGMTHSGPHRDDVSLSLDGKDLRLFGSAGQQRTAAIALRMLEGDTIRESQALAPVLLLDDPFAELDVRRSGRILELLRGSGMGQTVLVVPRASDIPPELIDLERRSIANGVIGDAA